GDARSGSCCNTKPILRSARTASCAAASERSRLIATGTTVPGNSTRLRTGTMMSMSSEMMVFSDGVVRSSLRSESFIAAPGLALDEAQDQASVRVTSFGQLVVPRRQRKAPLEAPIRNLQPMQGGRVPLHGQRTDGRNRDQAALRMDLDVLLRHARQCHRHLDLIPISHDVYGGFPARLGLDSAAEAEELPLQPLRLLQHFARFGPHPGGWVTNGHDSDPSGTWRVRWGLRRQSQEPTPATPLPANLGPCPATPSTPPSTAASTSTP